MRSTITLMCAYCHAQIQRERRKLNTGQVESFCNRACYHAYRREKVASVREQVRFNCENCGIVVERYKGDYKKFPRHYCSVKCAAAKKDRSYLFLISDNGKTANSQKTFLKRRYVDECAVCRWSLASCDVHHIVPAVVKPVAIMEDLIILCPNHHRLAEFDKLSVDELRSYRRLMRLRDDIPRRISDAILRAE